MDGREGHEHLSLAARDLVPDTLWEPVDPLLPVAKKKEFG
ncbi:hypothetical protein STIAU_2758 [Stigmatella aurantiaca DW4/3-1]|uniref:Uncharacterized protein n=1 Tax=Stigmatella aurantiaca (strain DW4/3-1) TaxID=378806 RepID=Q09AK4_STIAD|nr:hypothetical protein STIAU_2758 [Stigmatella aurantiaca DW4/3-1]